MFKIGSPVKGKDFIDRKKHLPIFKAHLDINQHVMIKAPRRFGKTSLVKHVFEFEGEYDYIYIDIRRATSLESLANQILDKAYSFVGFKSFVKEAKQSILNVIKSIDKLKMGDIAEISLKHFEKNDINELEYLIDALDVVDKIAMNKGINIKFVFDEFQDIIKLNEKSILEKLRSVMQHHENITYIFLGSIETVMNQIFSNDKSAFYKFAKIMDLQGLDIEETLIYVKELFAKLDFKYNEVLLEKVIRYIEGHPDYTSRVLQNLYIAGALNNKVIEDENYYESITSTLHENKAYLEELISKAKMKKHQYEVLVSIANNSTLELSAATLYNTKVSLEELGLLKNVSRGEYVINDVFLKLLLQQNNDEKLVLDEVIQIQFKENSEGMKSN